MDHRLRDLVPPTRIKLTHGYDVLILRVEPDLAVWQLVRGDEILDRGAGPPDMVLYMARTRLEALRHPLNVYEPIRTWVLVTFLIAVLVLITCVFLL